MKAEIYKRAAAAAVAAGFLKPLPAGFDSASGSWAWYSYDQPSIAVLPGNFNRTVFQAPSIATVDNSSVQALNQVLNQTDFVAYDERFFDIIGPKATVKKVQDLPLINHEAACLNSNTGELFFVEWGPPNNHTWQFIFDTRNSTLRNITTSPPTTNVHGCVFYKDNFYVVTDGGGGPPDTYASLVQIEPGTLKATHLLNNFYQQAFIGFNDLEIDQQGNFWLTDSVSAWNREFTDFAPQTPSQIYYVDGKTFRPRVVDVAVAANGIAISPDGKTLYWSESGALLGRPPVTNPFGPRTLTAYTVGEGGIGLNKRLFTQPITYWYDGVRVSRYGYIFTAAGEGIEVIEPESGNQLGIIRVGPPPYVAINLAFGDNEIWVVGVGGIWHIQNIAERLRRDW